MAIERTVEQDLTQAMKSKNADRVSTLRLLKAALTNYKIEKKKDALDDPEMLEIIQRQVKQRKESLESFEKAGRTDLAEKEKRELAILQAYLPKQLEDAQLKALVQQSIEKCGAKVKADAGKVMKELMPAVKGKADGKRVIEMVLSLLS